MIDALVDVEGDWNDTAYNLKVFATTLPDVRQRAAALGTFRRWVDLRCAGPARRWIPIVHKERILQFCRGPFNQTDGLAGRLDLHRIIGMLGARTDATQARRSSPKSPTTTPAAARAFRRGS